MNMTAFLNTLSIRILTRDFRREDGQAMTEYAVILAVIVVAVIATLVLLQAQIINIFTNIKDALIDAQG
jgi:Flp pilus assembly pilin Flp